MAPSPGRRAAIVVVAIGVAAICVALGFWQLRRLDDRRAANDAIVQARSGSPVTIRSAADVAPLAPFRRVVAQGAYDVDGEVIVYGRALEGRPGHHVVTPLVLGDGSAVMVIRGWVPFEMDAAPVEGAEPIAPDVTVEGFLVPPEPGDSGPPDARGAVRSLDPEAIARPLPYDVAPLALQLQEQRPPQPDLPVPAPPPELSEGPHLSYAIQWFSFAAISLVGAAVLLGRDRRAATADP
jgi:surfeit locus 1 family protein